MTRRAPRRRPKLRLAPDAVQDVVDETIALYRWLAWVAEDLYGDDARGASRRWTLRRLRRDGPCTVSALAKVRAVRRQTLQPVIDRLLADRLVEAVPNPAHRRAPLIRITHAGSALVGRLDRVDAAVLRAVGKGLTPRELATAAMTLKTLRRSFETTMRWRPAAVAARGTVSS